MGQYKANSTNSRDFSLTIDNQKIGELLYKKWFSFNAEILLNNSLKYQLESKGVWDSKIELKDDTQSLLEFKMDWKGLIIKTLLPDKEQTFILILKGLLNSKFVLLDSKKEELMLAKTDFKWSKLNYDYNIETTQQFDSFDKKELLLLTIVHCTNYYRRFLASS